LTVSHDTPRYLFLMRHAQHDEGHLTEEASAHIRSLAMRFSEWVQAEWRNPPRRTIRLWFTSTSTEVQETADALTRNVLAHVRPSEGQAKPYPFVCPPPGSRDSLSQPRRKHRWRDRRGHSTGRSGDGREPWMPALVPPSATQRRDSGQRRDPGHKRYDLGQDLAAYSPDEQAFERLCDWLEASGTGEQQARRSETDVPLLVGNDPLIGWVASKLTRRDTPVARGELVCLVERRAGTRWRLLWTLSEDGETEAEAIRTKIKSKMNTAGALGAVIVGLTTFLLQNSLQKEPTVWQWLAFAALAVSAGLYFASLFLYDTLQMPPRFWSNRFPYRPRNERGFQAIWARLRHGRPSVARPPTSTARVLQASMVQVWNWIFTPATVLAGVGVACLALGASTDSDPVGLRPWQVLSAIVVLTAVAGTWVAWQRPNLGASD
jgi:hypothetical protein